MKNILIFIMTVSLGVFSTVPGLASLLRRDFTAIEGPVVAKKDKESQIVIRIGEAEHVFSADPSQFASANVGDTVLILHQIDNPAISTMVVTAPAAKP